MSSRTWLATYLTVGVLLLIQPASAELLDDAPGALAAYSLRRLRSAYTGPAVQVRRSTDNQVADIGFTPEGDLDVASLVAFVGSGDGEVVRWYSQIDGNPPLAPPEPMLGPLLVEQGQLSADGHGLPRLKFFRADALRVADPGLPFDLDDGNITVHLVIENEPSEESSPLFQIEDYAWQGHSLTILGGASYRLSGPGYGADALNGILSHEWNVQTFSVSSTSTQLYQNHEKVADVSMAASSRFERYFVLGARARTFVGAWSGHVGELIVYPYTGAIGDIRARTDAIAGYWRTGPDHYNPDALLPQRRQYQVDIYDWLETLSVADLDLPAGSLTWDTHYESVDTLADLYMSFAAYKASSLSRVTRQESKWLVLNDGNGAGIEGTGKVRLLHGTGGNNRSWGNEPAYWYSLRIPLAGGGNGNPYYHQRALCLRALVITAVDMLMYDTELDKQSSLTWNDMHGKALLSWSEALYICRSEISSSVLAAFEAGLARNLELSIETGPRDVNTNMDMFTVEAAANIARESADPALQMLALRAAKRLLLGYDNGVPGVRHDVNAGSFYPAGYIGENDMADCFYNGESYYHIAGAWAKTHSIDGWQWLGDVLRAMSVWRIYHAFPDPFNQSYDGPSGFSGRTSDHSLHGQQSLAWRDVTAVDLLGGDVTPLLHSFSRWGTYKLPSHVEMTQRIARQVTLLSADWGIVDTTAAPTWNGWSPWPKVMPFLPPPGWYTRLRNRIDGNDDELILPIERPNASYSKAFGGAPTGMEFWVARKQYGGKDFSWYVEADAQQGTYGGWYGGKLELFWTRATGPMIINRHGKTGCDAEDGEDSTCWAGIDTWGAHHVWGRDERGRAFSQVHLKGRALDRPVSYSPTAEPRSVEITNKFNDPGAQVSGEEAPDVLQGSFAVTNRFEAIDNGLKITHIISSDQQDQLSELWATIPVRLGEVQGDDTSIEAFDGAQWQALTTSFRHTEKIRLGKTGTAQQYVYIVFAQPQRVKLSAAEYQSPYQTTTRIRNIHIDLHGTPGSSAPAPVHKSVLYAIAVTDEFVDTAERLAPAAPSNLRVDR
ncbi:MAG: hypothetical protein KDD69_01980 [Bdellovibrionales bacterium]|nr:hypothetical protein [Bdellovibrionales bacterium]